MSFLSPLKKYLLPSLLLAVGACSHMPKKIQEEARDSNSFYISKGNLIYVYAQPIRLRPVLSGIPGVIPAAASTNLEAVYLDYSPLLLQGKVFGKLPQQWINASLWERRRSFENHSTLRESRYKIKGSNLYLSLPNKRMAYLSSEGFYSKERESQIRMTSSTQSMDLLERSRSFPLFLRVSSISDLLSALKIELPPIVRLPFDELETTLTLKEKDAILDLSFKARKGTPPALAVRFAMNYVLGQYPATPLSKAWKRVPITANPDEPSAVGASVQLTQAELNESLSIIAKAYYKEQARKEKEERERP